MTIKTRRLRNSSVICNQSHWTAPMIRKKQSSHILRHVLCFSIPIIGSQLLVLFVTGSIQILPAFVGLIGGILMALMIETSFED